MEAATTMISRRGELSPYRGDFYLWKYVPSVAAAVIFLILFLAASLMHAWKMCKMRMWFCIPFVIGGFLEVIGYGGRIGANKATESLGPYIIQSVFLLVPPSLFAASIYMTLGRVMRDLGPAAEQLSIIRISWLTKTFVIGDAFAFLIQSSGAGYMAAGSGTKTGEIIVIFGLVVQIAFFGLFVVSAVLFHKRYNARLGARASFDWEKIMLMLYITSALILVRSIFRIIEYAAGSDGYLLANEWPLYIFDAVLMVAVMAVFYVWYPNDLQAKTAYTPGAINMSA